MARDFSKKFYKSKEWQSVREYALKRDKYLCQKCHAKPAQEVHHIIHLNEDNINDNNITLNADNLICLCRDCHFTEHYADKGKGHSKHADVLPEYTFDENGMLINKQ